MLYNVTFFLFHEKAFFSMVSEVTVRVWAGVEFCSFIIAGMGLDFILGLTIKKCLCCIPCLSGVLVLSVIFLSIAIYYYYFNY